MAFRQLLLVLATVQMVTAQNDIIGSLFSVAESFVTSVLAPPSSTSTSSSNTASTTQQDITSSASSSFIVSSTTASPASSANSAAQSTTYTSLVNSPSSTTPSVVQTSAAAVSASSGNDGGSSNTLAIVLGCTLGALALAAFLALIFFCRRRRRRSQKVSKHQALSMSDDEGETWHHEKPRVRSLKEPSTEVRAINTPYIGMTENHPYTGAHNDHQNPFVPVPPPTRRSGHHGVHDDIGYSAHPYHPEDVGAYDPTHPAGTPDHHGSHALAAGAGGAALGGLAAHAKHRHDRKRSASRGRTGDLTADHGFSEDDRNALPEATSTARRSGSVSRASAKEPWPFMDAAGKKSSESFRSRSRGASLHHDRFSTPDQYPADSRYGASGPALASAAAAGGLAGAAIGGKSHSPSPHRKGILRQTVSDSSSDPSSLTTEDVLSTGFSRSASRPVSSSGPHELASPDIRPLTPSKKRDRALGSAAPLVAAAAVGSAAAHHRRSGRGDSKTPSTPLAPLVIPHEREPPMIPSRSPKRTSLDYSRARYSSANEGTVELPSEQPQQPLVSPTIDAKKATENDGLLSPVSPISESQTGSWSKAHAEQLGLGRRSMDAKTSSQESTAINTVTPDDGSSGSDHQSSGLVSAIQRIFNSGKQPSEDNEALVNQIHSDEIQPSRERRLRNVPHRKPAPDRLSHQPVSQYGDIADQQQHEVMPGSWDNGPSRNSGESRRSLPPQYRSHRNSSGNRHDDGFTPAIVNGNRPRAHSRPGYGIGSGDPFDLARTRTDSSMTGISLSNYQEPAANASRPRSHRQSSGPTVNEPTLADLRREVMAEDHQRAQKAWRNSRSHSRSGSAGLRYGDDKDLYDLLDQTAGHGRYYAAPQQDRRGSLGGNVGRAF